MENATVLIILHASSLIRRAVESLDDDQFQHPSSDIFNENIFEILLQARGFLEMMLGQSHFETVCHPFTSSIQFGLGVIHDCIHNKETILNFLSTQDDEKHSAFSRSEFENKNLGDNQTSICEVARTPKLKGWSDNDSQPVQHQPDLESSSCLKSPKQLQEPDDCFCIAESEPFNEIIGQNEAKTSLFENIVLPLQLPECLLNSVFVGIRQASPNVLLFGPPGTGKTTLAKAASAEAGATLFNVSPSHILSKYQGESERKLKDIFDTAKQSAPSIIFFDEIDCLGTCRGSSIDVQARRLLAELLLQMNDISSKDKVAMIGATNRLEDMDPALLRRFYSRVFVGVPSHEDRKRIFCSYMKDVQHELSVHHLEELAIQTNGWSGSDLETLCREAAMAPLRDVFRGLRVPNLAVLVNKMKCLRPVSIEDFGHAYEILMKPSMLQQQEEGILNDNLGSEELDNETL